MGTEIKVIVVAAFACACAFAALADEHVGKNLERGEPARWSQPDDTPEKRQATAIKEAKAALAEAMKSCRESATDRKSCENEAREQYRADIAAAQATR
jgi:hypothetical protein